MSQRVEQSEVGLNTSRIRRAKQPDTPADVELKECLRARRSFVMVAGAGSGKTTSLIKAIAAVLDDHGAVLKAKRQRIACITYTDVAAAEIWEEVGNNPLVHVSTIHSFLWSVCRSFQADIAEWVGNRIEEKLGELRTTAANFSSRVRERTREKNRREILRYERERVGVASVKTFTYGTGSNYSKGILGHDDILKLGTQLLEEGEVFRTVVAQQFPFMFVDESQDTAAIVVQALKTVEVQNRSTFCLGFFGDPMQRIYLIGLGEISPEESWATITKPENFRCLQSVLNVANSIRRGGDGLHQTPGRRQESNGVLEMLTGTARLFVLPADSKREENISRVREWIARTNGDPSWTTPESVKVLVVVHRMAADRLGFGNLYAALNDKAPDDFKAGFLDASAWPVMPFFSFVLPVAAAIQNEDEFETMNQLRRNCDLLKGASVKGTDVAALLETLREASEQLSKMMSPSSDKTNRDVLQHLHQTRLFSLDPRLAAYLDSPPPLGVDDDDADDDDADDDDADEEELAKEISAMQAFLDCSATEFWGYQRYVNQGSPFSTQQGIKGTEFPRVLVVLDDEEGRHFQFSYDKYFGIKPLSEGDQENIQAGRETVVDRTRRLFYVCCTRALNDLAVVYFTPNPTTAVNSMRDLNIFPSNSIYVLEDLVV